MLEEYPIGEAFLAGPAQLSGEALRHLQERRFRVVLARAWQVPFYNRRWRAAGLEPGDVRGLDDIAKLPPFSKSDLMASVEAYPPWGDFHGVDLAAGQAKPNIVFHTTSGTTGTPQPIFYGAHDREVQNLMLARAYRLHGLQDDDVVQSVYGFGMVNGGHYIRETILHFTKAMLLTTGTGLETRSEQQIDMMRRFGVTVLVGFADYIKRLAEVAIERGIEPGRDIRLRLISGHLGRENRAAIEAMWGGAKAFDWYGVGDTGTICAEGPDRDGLYVFEDAHHLEILDPETGRPAAPGMAGNICDTVLFKTGVYPIVRFDTNDVSAFLPARANDPIQFRRVAGFQGRSDNMVKLRGINVYPTAIGVILAEHKAVAGEYVCRVTRQGTREEMTVLVEIKPGIPRDAALARELGELLRRKLGVELGIELVGLGATAPLTEIERRQKPVRLIDAEKRP
ncbi:MAG: phenylacetate--CoA ligase family protein [Alphaproteobacteria bacterium]|nr:phenylacetate--CoA ligase family protein [Alphaproteobacteria bacterium]